MSMRMLNTTVIAILRFIFFSCIRKQILLKSQSSLFILYFSFPQKSRKSRSVCGIFFVFSTRCQTVLGKAAERAEKIMLRFVPGCRFVPFQIAVLGAKMRACGTCIRRRVCDFQNGFIPARRRWRGWSASSNAGTSRRRRCAPRCAGRGSARLCRQRCPHAASRRARRPRR